ESNGLKASSNTSLIPLANIVITGTSSNCAVTVTPVANGNGGPVTVTLGLAHTGGNVLETFTVSVVSMNDAPTLAAGTAPSAFNENTTLTITLGQGQDLDTSASLTYQITTPPAQGVLSALAPSTTTVGSLTLLSGTIAYTPASNYNGPDSFQYRVCDEFNLCSASQTVNLTVTAVDSAPVISDIANMIISEDGSETAGFSITDIDTARTCAEMGTNGLKASSDTVLIPLANIVLGGTAPNCTVTVTPVANGNGGPVTITLGLTHSTNVLETFTVTVQAVNDSPQLAAGDTTVSVNENTAAAPANLTVTLGQGTDIDAASVLTYNMVVPPVSGTLGALPAPSASGANLNGTVVYTPVQNFNGSDSFTYKVCDQSNLCSANQTVNITVSSVNSAPVISDITDMVISEDGSATAGFSITDVDTSRTCTELENILKTSSNTTLIPLANIVITGTAPNCAVTVTPSANGNGGPVAITLGLTHTGGNVTETFNVTVMPVNDQPLLAAGAAPAPVAENTAASPTSLTVTLGQGTDIDASSVLTYNLVVPPVSGTLGSLPAASGSGLALNGTVVYTPVQNFNGSDSFTYKVCDQSNLCSANQTVNITVTASDSAPVISDITNMVISEGHFRYHQHGHQRGCLRSRRIQHH
ncbi:MAG: tandem-95 repeat protein, partial [Proteobacteria bacterium]|nr:tandem-95 repeat protein [Pseudomonadota bacterium]